LSRVKARTLESNGTIPKKKNEPLVRKKPDGTKKGRTEARCDRLTATPMSRGDYKRTNQGKSKQGKGAFHRREADTVTPAPNSFQGTKYQTNGGRTAKSVDKEEAGWQCIGRTYLIKAQSILQQLTGGEPPRKEKRGKRRSDHGNSKPKSGILGTADRVHLRSRKEKKKRFKALGYFRSGGTEMAGRDELPSQFRQRQKVLKKKKKRTRTQKGSGANKTISSDKDRTSPQLN